MKREHRLVLPILLALAIASYAVLRQDPSQPARPVIRPDADWQEVERAAFAQSIEMLRTADELLASLEEGR